MKFLNNIFKQTIGELKLYFQRKWVNDCRYLPLTAAHRELYDIIHRLYWDKLNDFPNLIDCRDFNDRIQWLKLFDQDREIVRCSDKILVRDYVSDRVGEQYLNKVFQIHDHFSQIDFDLLPDKFAIKTNHDSGTVILVRDKKQLDKDILGRRIEASLRMPYGWEKGEWAYSYIKPKVFVEELLEWQSIKPPPDYKFYCVEGNVKFCHYIYNRGFETKEQIIDSSGKDMGVYLYNKFKYGTDFNKPRQWVEMIDVAMQLSRGFKCVRVDLFCTNEKVSFGEMTFWPMGGHYKGEGQKVLGHLLDFDRTTFKPFLLPTLEAECSRFSLYPDQGGRKV